MGTLAVSNRYKLDTGYVEVDKGGNVTRFNKKPECNEKLKHIGISLFTSEIFELIRDLDENLHPDVVGTAIQMGRKMQCYVHDGQWHHFQHISKYHFEHVVNYDKWFIKPNVSRGLENPASPPRASHLYYEDELRGWARHLRPTRIDTQENLR